MSSLFDFTILILDDDELWLARHERRLKQAGLTSHATDLAKDAIRALKTNPSIKFALIDEILYVPPIPLAESDRELQSVQGMGVIREINKLRSDVQFIVVTSAPYARSGGDTQLFRRETASLRRHLGVIDIIHKIDIEDDPEAAYDWLIDLLKRSQNTAKAEVVKPKILIGLGFTKEEHEAMAEQMGVKRGQYMPIAPLLKKGGGARIIDSFWERAKEKSVLLEMPGSKKLDRLSGIRPNSSAFRILSFLAQHAEKQEETLICEKDYQHSTRRPRKNESDISDFDNKANRDFAFGYSEDGRRGLNKGIQIEGKSQQSSPLKVAIHRLSQQLQKLNVGPSNQLFNFERDGYRPSFELGIVVYAVRSSKVSN